MNYKEFLRCLAGVLIMALVTFFGYNQYKAEVGRTELAESWSNDDFNFTATGDASRTLTVEPIGYDAAQKPIVCSLFVGSITNDAKLSGELAGAGFTKIQCGELVADLK